jgi:hypothetical protein
MANIKYTTFEGISQELFIMRASPSRAAKKPVAA